MEVTYEVDVEQDDTPVRGNAMASGDADADKAVEDEILGRLDQGDVWAWALVKVTAKCEGFTGTAYLGGCSYKDEKEFQEDGYFEQLKHEAFEDLIEGAKATVENGNRAAEFLKTIK